jgi:uncharacterized protein YecT (DUF1311 family)
MSKFKAALIVHVFLLLLTIPNPVFGEEYKFPVTSTEIIDDCGSTAGSVVDANKAMREAYAVIDAERVRVFNKIINCLGEERKAVSETLKRSEAIWLKLREEQSAIMFYIHNDKTGKINMAVRALIRMTLGRTDYLKINFPQFFQDEVRSEELCGIWHNREDQREFIELYKEKGALKFRMCKNGQTLKEGTYEIKDGLFITRDEKGANIFHDRFVLSDIDIEGSCASAWALKILKGPDYISAVYLLQENE